MIPMRAGVQRACNEVVLIARHPHQRRDVEPSAAGDLLLHHIDAGSRMLHVEENELGARALGALRQARREELESE